MDIDDGKHELPKQEVTRLKKRKLIEEKQETSFTIRKGTNYQEKKV